MYEPMDFSHLIGTPGFSDQLLKNHFKLYEGYVTNTNKLAEKIKNDEAGTPEAAELKRRFGWEFNGMRLHELYFGNMTKDKKELPEDSPLRKAMDASFGSGEKCHADFKSTGSMRGIGWTIMYCDPQSGMLTNNWINEHDLGHMAGAEPLLVLDVFEHAYMIDYGLDRASYIDAFIAAIDWDVVQKRFEKCQK